jgi:hypothetical protein
MKYWGGARAEGTRILGGSGAFPPGKFLKFGPENLRTHFVKNLGFPNIVLKVHFFINHMLSTKNNISEKIFG